jgi:hypothetical protein
MIMNKAITRSIAIASMVSVSVGIVHADESAFLQPLAGSWSGKGTVKVRINAPTINVTCNFKSDTTAGSLALDGRCTSLVVSPGSLAPILRQQVIPMLVPMSAPALALPALGASARVTPSTSV